MKKGFENASKCDPSKDWKIHLFVDHWYGDKIPMEKIVFLFCLKGIIDPNSFDILCNMDLIKNELSWRIWKKWMTKLANFSLNHPKKDNTNVSVNSEVINLSLKK